MTMFLCTFLSIASETSVGNSKFGIHSFAKKFLRSLEVVFDLGGGGEGRVDVNHGRWKCILRINSSMSIKNVTRYGTA